MPSRDASIAPVKILFCSSAIRKTRRYGDVFQTLSLVIRPSRLLALCAVLSSSIVTASISASAQPFPIGGTHSKPDAYLQLARSSNENGLGRDRLVEMARHLANFNAIVSTRVSLCGDDLRMANMINIGMGTVVRQSGLMSGPEFLALVEEYQGPQNALLEATVANYANRYGSLERAKSDLCRDVVPMPTDQIEMFGQFFNEHLD